MSESRAARRWLAVILLVSLVLNTVGIRWGLPNDDGTWAADALQPLTPMAVGKHVLFGERWNSGWFYFKYPLGHPLILLAAQAPYLGWLRMSGEFHAPSSTYPYGFKHPERAVNGLALITRLVSALMGVGVVALAFAIASTLFGATAGAVAAVLTAGCYPLVFYAHTSNVDVPLLFWSALSVAGALWCGERDSVAAAVLTGLAVAMALLTKEQSIGALVMVPVVWALGRPHGARFELSTALRHAAAAATAFVVVTVIVGDVWWNPGGYVNRWRFLLGTLPAAIREKYAPYQFAVQVPKGFSLARELQHLAKVVGVSVQALTIPVTVLCLAGLVWGLWRRPRAAVVPLLLIVAYYVFSLRALALVPVRYTMPLLFFAALLGGAAGGALIEALRRSASPAKRAAVAVIAIAGLAWVLLPGVEVDRLLLHDARYAAEAWLRAHAPAGARVETYQPATYLPRLAPTLKLARVPVEERTVAQFQQRRPDLVLLSSGGRAGLTGHYAKDWKPGGPVFVDLDAAKQFFQALRAEQLGYREVARLHTPPCWITPRINSLNPEITILAPEHG